MLQQGRFDQIAELAVRKKRALGTLVSLTFELDPLIAWRAVEAIGVAAARVAEGNPDYVRNLLRRLYWLLSEESGGVCWRAPEAMAEILRRYPGPFDDYIPVVVSLIVEMAEEDLDHFRPGCLWAIGRLGPLAEEWLPPVLPTITAALDHPDPQLRGTAVWCLGQVGQTTVLAARPDLLTDEGPVDLYGDGQLQRTAIGRLTQRILGGG